MKRILIKSEDRLLKTLCYIHHNPIHHGFAADYEVWPWSSFKSIKRFPFKQNDIELFRTKDDYLKVHSEFKSFYKRNEADFS